MERSLSKRAKLLIGVAILVLLFPTPHTRRRTEPYTDYEVVEVSDLVAKLNCSRRLDLGNPARWLLSYVPPGELRLVVSIVGTGDFVLRVESATGEVIQRTGRIHKYVLEVLGPPVRIEAVNLGLSGRSIEIRGEIEVYYDRTTKVQVTKYREVNYTVWLPWWLP